MPHYGSPQLVDWSNPISDHPLNDGLVAWWMAVPGQMGWKTTSLADLGRKYPGTLTNLDAQSDYRAVQNASVFGEIDVNGSNQSVNFGTPSDITSLASNFTIAAWIKIGSTTRVTF